ncbi:MAG: BamA/TamA family outer membrane protein [Candidatus Eisenbacteria bacterium]|uniref:BamA/TamA family outer membrane protein n=1 Tax=Eiseniibacteriota bacterium TaxID=2212470 RepID=A0A849SKT7_UNCEI|nr:BamA/TamA family outer membrane protein [Candidatus Eisenbacteria bacterium]
MRFVPFARFSLFLLVLAVTPAAVFAQGYGKNKVHYEKLDWGVLETAHLRLHFYSQEESLARRLAPAAESVCVEYDRRFRMRPRKPVPFLLYSAHHVFQQTNATPGLISEGTGGLTELIKGRVLVPHNGSWKRLVWVTRHEMAHSYMLEKIAQVMREHRRPMNYLPPLWFTEGLAEYCGTRWDEDAEGLLRDAVISGRAMPLTRSESITGTVLMYKEGQSFLLFLADRYGPDKVFDLLDQWHRAESFETLFRIIYGRPLAELDAEWFDSLRKHYYPAVASADHPQIVMRRMTRKGDFNLGVRVLPGALPTDSTARDSVAGNPAFCYFAAGEDGIQLRINEPVAGRKRRDRGVLRGGVSPSFESFHLFQNRPAVARSGHIALSAKQGGRDMLYLLAGSNGRVLRRVDLPLLVAINDPAVTPDGDAIVFSAQDYSGRSDLYRVSWPNERVQLEQLTRDDFDDVEPGISPDGRWVVFASDRGSATGEHQLFRLSLSGGVPEPLGAPAAGEDRQPVVSPDGQWVAFRSTRGGTSDLWVRSIEPSPDVRRATRLLGPASDPDWLADGRGLLFIGQDGIEFQVYRTRFNPDTLDIETSVDPSPLAAAMPAPILGMAPEHPPTGQVHGGPRLPYERRIALDIVQGGFAADPGVSGGAAGGQIALSDVLGNEQLYVLLANDSDRYGSFLDGFQIGLTYLNQSQRFNYGVGAFRLTETYDADLDAVVREPRVGLTLLGSYPFNKFLRLDGSLVARHSIDHRLRSGQIQDLDLVSQYVSLVHDNARWSMLGPSGGTRWAATAGYTRDLTADQGTYGTLQFDARRYQKIGSGMVSATRMNAQASFGPDAQRFYLGGLRALRGWDRRSLGGTQTALLQQEFRVPLVRGLVLGIPAAWELPTIGAAAWADAGYAHDRLDPFAAGDVSSDDLKKDRTLGSAGFGVYLGGGYFPAIRWDFAWLTRDFKSFSDKPTTRFWIGYNF